ncbi:MAG: gluconeogenesis factor YvcK family protein, partial [Exiguobacterium oxidotolerans]
MKWERKVVAIGGGTGLSTLLRGLKHYPLDITAIVTVADDGGSSGRLRTEFNMLPPGDIRNVIVSLSKSETLMDRIMQYRFETGEGLHG